MLKKAGFLTAGVTAALLVAAPLASAGEYKGDYDKDRDNDRDRDRDNGHEFGDVDGKFNNQCLSEGGDVENDARTSAGLIGIGQAVGPALNGSNVNILDCANILNNNLNDNNVAVSVLGSAGSGIVP